MLRRLVGRVIAALIPGESTTERAVTGGIWETALNVSDRILRLVMLVIVANFLEPADFGLLGIAFLTLGALERFSELGLNRALIQHRDENVDDYLDTAWSLHVVRGVAIAGILFVSAPAVGSFFSEPRATGVIRAIGFVPLILSVQNPGVMYLDKHMEFHKRFVYKLAGSLSYVIVGVGAAIVLQNVWALVLAVFADRSIRTIASYFLHGYRPWPSLDLTRAKEMYSFGMWINASAIILFLFSSGDDAFVGWFLGASALGFYQIAYRFSNAPATEVTHIVSRVAFPAYSRVQDDLEKLREGFFRTLKLTTFVSFPMAAGIFVTAPVFVEGFLGSNWLPMVVVMQVLSIHGATRSFGATLGPLFEAIGRPDISTKLQALNLLVLAVLIYPLTSRWGIEGAALAVVGVSILLPLPIYLVMRSINGSYRRFFSTLVYPLIGCLMMGIGVALVSRLVELESAKVEFVVLVIVGVSIYGLVIAGSEKWFNYRIQPLFRSMVDAIT